MTKLVKTGGEIQAQDFGKALGEAFERVEKRPKKKKRKKKVVAQQLVHNPAFDPGVLVQSGRASFNEPNIANMPRRGDETRELASGEDPSLEIGVRIENKSDDIFTWSFSVFGKSVL